MTDAGEDSQPASNPHAWMSALAGKFLAFEGADGSGKSTQLARFVACAEAAGLTVCELREPGGTVVGEAIRAVLLDHASEGIALSAEMFLYMASRAQLVKEKVRPALARGELVVADRFVPSTIAYQGAVGGMPEDDIRAVAQIATGGIAPDPVVVIDVDDKTALRRTEGVSRKRTRPSDQPTLFQDRMERKMSSAWAQIRESYVAQAKAEPDRFIVVDGAPDEDTVHAAMLDAIRAHVVK